MLKSIHLFVFDSPLLFYIRISLLLGYIFFWIDQLRIDVLLIDLFFIDLLLVMPFPSRPLPHLIRRWVIYLFVIFPLLKTIPLHLYLTLSLFYLLPLCLVILIIHLVYHTVLAVLSFKTYQLFSLNARLVYWLRRGVLMQWPFWPFLPRSRCFFFIGLLFFDIAALLHSLFGVIELHDDVSYLLRIGPRVSS